MPQSQPGGRWLAGRGWRRSAGSQLASLRSGPWRLLGCPPSSPLLPFSPPFPPPFPPLPPRLFSVLSPCFDPLPPPSASLPFLSHHPRPSSCSEGPEPWAAAKEQGGCSASSLQPLEPGPQPAWAPLPGPGPPRGGGARGRVPSAQLHSPNAVMGSSVSPFHSPTGHRGPEACAATTARPGSSGEGAFWSPGHPWRAWCRAGDPSPQEEGPSPLQQKAGGAEGGGGGSVTEAGILRPRAPAWAPAWAEARKQTRRPLCSPLGGGQR